jgi:anti-sigma regulatory factor (Ser/Thr protein kinase)
MTLSEAISFFPSKVEYQDNQQPSVEITGLKIFDKPMAIDSDWIAHKPIHLSYQENFLTIEFAALSFLSLQQINYYYRLQDVDKDWVNGGSNRFANYTDLQPGEYLFEVKTENGGNSGKVSSLKFNISPPFWKTWWFKGLIIFSILWAIYLFIKTRESNLKARQQTQIEIYSMNEQLSKAKLEALRSQMNPHFIFNCINSIDALIQSNDKYRATIYLNKFAKLIMNVLDSSKQDTVTLSKDLDTLKLYIELEQLRHEDKFTANIVADEALLLEDFEVPPLIIQPFVENAILHGLRYRSDNRGQLSISVSKQGDYLLYQIEDNGVGRNSANDSIQKGKTSYGIDMSNERVKLFNVEEKASVTIIDLFDQDEPAGTKVEVLLKIQ